jgi:hypothetical protein
MLCFFSFQGFISSLRGGRMEVTSMPRILAFSAILALGAGLGEAKPAVPAKSSLPGAYRPETGKAGHPTADKPQNPETEPVKDPENGPNGPSRPTAKEDKTDCDDCVIVRNGTGEAPGTLLAGTLWGLFLVRRPRRMPRAVIRGVTVP